MFQTTANPRSVRSWFDVNAQKHAGSCLRTWPTLAMVNYFQNERLASPQDSYDSSNTQDRVERQERTERIRAELQDLLRNAYIEAGKAKPVDKEMAGR